MAKGGRSLARESDSTSTGKSAIALLFTPNGKVLRCQHKPVMPDRFCTLLVVPALGVGVLERSPMGLKQTQSQLPVEHTYVPA